MMVAFPASIPSPSSGALTIGPLSIHAYGLMIALGVIAAVWLLGRRLESKGQGTREDASAIAVWSRASAAPVSPGAAASVSSACRRCSSGPYSPR